MTTGLFIHRGVGQGRAFQKSHKSAAVLRHAARANETNKLADALAEGLTLEQAAAQIGLTIVRARSYLADMARRLGSRDEPSDVVTPVRGGW